MSLRLALGALDALYLRHATVVSYMLQSTEYAVLPYLQWYWRTQNFATVMHRRVLNPTRRARLLRMALAIGMGLQAALGVACIVAGLVHTAYYGVALLGVALLLSYPIVWAHLIVLPLLAVKWLLVEPKNRRLIARSAGIFAKHPAVKIAVAGSYGKTTMKEMLATVLEEGKKVAATPANKNVAISHAVFASRLKGDEEVLIIEYGEGAPGDVKRFAATTHPTHAVITGLAPAHLDKYKTLQAAGEDIFSVANAIKPAQVYVNAESPSVTPFMRPQFQSYGQTGVGDWRVGDVRVAVDGTSFSLTSGKRVLHLHSRLLGRHQVGPLSCAAALALELGLTNKQVETGVAKTVPFEHRMQPYQLGSAWIIDDTYNGNLEGIRAGTQLLRELTAKRKWYVTPGLVDQGSDTARIHEEAGKAIADAKPDIVVLMQNSVTRFIQKGLTAGGYDGDVRIETDPLGFYTNLEHFVTAGDLVLMQNDWTDNYA